jgi:O-antigen/teichoic acid export membrane protein
MAALAAVYGSILFVSAYTTNYRSLLLARGMTGPIAASAAASSVFMATTLAAAILSGNMSLGLITLVLPLCALLELFCLSIGARTSFRLLLPSRPAFRIQARRVSPFAIQSVLATVYVRSPLLALGLLYGPRETGTFSLAGNLYSGINMLAGAVAIASYPRLSIEAMNGDRERIIAALRQQVVLAAVLASPLIIVGVLAPSELLTIVYGQTPDGAAYIVRLLVLGTALGPVNSLVVVGLLAFREEDRLATLSFVTAGISVVLSFVLSSQFGPTGAAWAVVLSDASTALLFLPLLYRTVERRTRVSLRRQDW